VEDSKAEVDMNVVMNRKVDFIELQGTGEERPFNNIELMDMLELATIGNQALIEKMKETLGSAMDRVLR